jgi:hypothetical protein
MRYDFPTGHVVVSHSTNGRFLMLPPTGEPYEITAEHVVLETPVTDMSLDDLLHEYRPSAQLRQILDDIRANSPAEFDDVLIRD